ncbi:hypothetical protein GOP47_0016768 [Adiantum capillus-veneris]|uniref:Neprosin PEP catalytic domain-containing protein n=1 Tax=Adiantum capillus-veneris TaxID=13818 RepID=A0A9D4ZAM3_ADICA|nr:hypothetical protein GOP47_0016768 [Adiantum capillus-veneris]
MACKLKYFSKPLQVRKVIPHTLLLVALAIILLPQFNLANQPLGEHQHGSNNVEFPTNQLHPSVQRKLAEVNKPAIKSIQSADGDVIDCVPMEQQPAFDHPLLKGHTIREYPSSRPYATTRNSTRMMPHKGHWQLWKESGETCPQGTVPIRRTSPSDVLRASSIQRFGRKARAQHLNITLSQKPVAPHITQHDSAPSAHDHAIAYVSGGVYFGSTATINVWDPSVEDRSEFSLSQMWILAGPFNGDLNTIEVGWQVSPELYGDSHPRFFIYWTADAYEQTGCYNLLCSGFIQTSNAIAMGASISPWSKDHSSQYDIKILIWKDPEKGDWWMEFGDRVLVGYWPAKLFTHLRNKATVIEWGGEVAQAISPSLPRRHTKTHMGSGRFAQAGFGHASYFRNVEVVNSENQLETISTLSTSADHPSCYNIRAFYNSNWGNFFYYGGPGRNPACP